MSAKSSKINLQKLVLNKKSTVLLFQFHKKVSRIQLHQRSLIPQGVEAERESCFNRAAGTSFHAFSNGKNITVFYWQALFPCLYSGSFFDMDPKGRERKSPGFFFDFFLKGGDSNGLYNN